MSDFSFEMDQSLAARLARLAEQRSMSPGEIAAIAIGEFIDREDSDIAEIAAGMLDADRGNFASEAEIAAVFDKYAVLHPAK